MSEDPSNEDESLEAIDLVINVLKEHEKNLDRLIGELDKVAENLGPSPEVTKKIEGIEQRLASLQAEISKAHSLAKELPGSKELPTPTTYGAIVNFNCRNWEDFRVLAKGAESVLFTLNGTDKSFKASASKEGRFLTYNGELREIQLLKCWLARELNVSEDNVFESA